MAVIQDAINELREEIAEREEQIKLLNDVERLVAKNGLTEELYHKLCLTPLRHSDMLGETLAKVFPFLAYKERQPNAFVYETLDGLIVEIPSNALEEVVFLIPDLCTSNAIKQRDKNHAAETGGLRKRIETANAFLNEQNIFKQLRIAYPKGNICIAALRYVFGGATKRYKRQLEAATEALANIEKRYERETKEVLERREEQKHRMGVYAPLFLQWTTRIFVCCSDAYSRSCLPNITITKDENGEPVYTEST